MNTNVRILIIDDDPLILQGTAHVLRSSGYTVSTAATGGEGLRMVREQRPDLVLLDVVLPDINGLEVCRRVKADPALAGVYVILISGLRTASDEQAEGLEAGADAYIERPITNRELLARVQALLRIRQTEQDLAHYAAALQRSNEDLQQFAYVISHDLKAPLRVVKGFLTLLQQKTQGQLDEEAEEFLDFATDGTDHMERLINALLEYARVDSRGRDPVPTDAEAVLAGVLQSLALSIEGCDPGVTHDPLPTVLVDPTQLHQLFQNLINNALKFSDGQQPPRVHIGAERQDDGWVFSVEDNGIGIAEKDRTRIFGVFQRLHTDEEYEGTGIGLAICKKIVERHGGRIWVESEVGVGSTFYFTLPEA